MVSKVYIYLFGDPPVGIRSYSIAIDLGVDVDNYDGYRETIRNSLGACFAEILGQSVDVRFEDELKGINW